jgi:endonuclease/exonuclease/phosphatase family metal-dependent hydrolase
MDKLSEKTILRVVCYNVHGCIGADRNVDTRRTTNILREIDADIVALQEVDGYASSHNIQNQAESIAERLGSNSVCFPLERKSHHLFGLAVLSRFTFDKVDFIKLPNLYPRLNPTKRGAIITHLNTTAGPVRLINTHLSVFKRERKKQLDALMESCYPNAENGRTPTILCGDLNAEPSSHTCRTLSKFLANVRNVPSKAMLFNGTFHARSPVFTIDHIFVSKHFIPLRVEVKNTPTAASASDHLPLVAELAIASERGIERNKKIGSPLGSEFS